MTMTTKHRKTLAFTLSLALIPVSAYAAPKIFSANDYGAKPDGTTLNTAAIQRTIDEAAPTHGTVTFAPGTYLTGSLFLKSNTTFYIGMIKVTMRV